MKIKTDQYRHTINVNYHYIRSYWQEGALIKSRQIKMVTQFF